MGRTEPGGQEPPLFDCHLHPYALRSQDLETMRFFGVTRALAVAHHLPSPSPKTLLAHLEALLSEELPRMRRAGLTAYAAVGVHPRAIPRRGLSAVLAALPELLSRRGVVALGEVGLSSGGQEEEEAFVDQVALARRLKLPLIVHTPTEDKERHTRRILVLLRKAGIPPARVLVDHASARTVRLILACGHYAGLTLHPDTLSPEKAVGLIQKLGSERLVLNTDAGDRPGDILSLPRAAGLLSRARLSRRLLSRVTALNAEDFLRLPP